ncbi:MAG: hypothetical protein EGR71_05355 [Clostridiales bacterium]|nr:hypothetical protein [Clostridiales bacterium]
MSFWLAFGFFISLFIISAMVYIYYRHYNFSKNKSHHKCNVKSFFDFSIYILWWFN